MKIIICGAGQVGYGIAECLAREQNDVTVVDALPRLVRAVSNTLDVRGIIGWILSGCFATGRRARCRYAIAATSTDEVNMVACQITHSLFEIPTKIARVRAQDYLELEWRNLFSRDNLPIDGQGAVGDMVMRRLALPGPLKRSILPTTKSPCLAFACGRIVRWSIQRFASSPNCFPISKPPSPVSCVTNCSCPVARSNVCRRQCLYDHDSSHIERMLNIQP